MKMKNLFLLLCFAAISGIVTAAEKQSQTTNEITKEAMRANKKAIVANNMMLTPEQEKTFWPLYDDYQIELNKLNADREALVKKFAVNFNSVTDEIAKELLNKAVELEKMRLELRKKLVSKFEAKFSPKIVARYYQIENKLDSALMAEAAGQIPLVK